MNQKIKTELGLAIIIVLAFVVGVFAWIYQKNISTEQHTTIPSQKIATPKETMPSIVGGPCSYDKVPGTCTILAIAKDNMAKFTFTSSEALPATELAKNLNGEHFDSLGIENKTSAIKVGDKIACEASLETKGTCTPVIFKLTETSNKAMIDWKTYVNEKYGFEFQYPASFNLKEEASVTENDNGELYLASLDKSSSSSLLVVLINRKYDPKEEVLGGMVNMQTTQKVSNKTAYKYKTGDGNCDGTLVRIPIGESMLDLRFSDCAGTNDMATIQNRLLSSLKFF